MLGAAVIRAEVTQRTVTVDAVGTSNSLDIVSMFPHTEAELCELITSKLS